MARRLDRLTLDNLACLPTRCRSCAFWELDPVRRERAVTAGEAAGEKEAWLSRVLLEWGSCGRLATVDGEPAGYVLYAPPSFLPGSESFPTAPVGEDAVLLATLWVDPAFRGAGLGRQLMQTVVKDLVKRGGIRAVEAFGVSGSAARGSCVVPTDYLRRVGFKTQRAHPRHPRMRLELKSAVTWREEVESALERLVGAVRPSRVPVPGPLRERIDPH